MDRTTPAVATLVAATLLLAGCSAASGLAGSTWVGGNLFDSNVTLEFTSGTECTLRTSFMGSGPCTYTYDGRQAVVTWMGRTYAYAINGSQLQGDLLGAGISLTKQ